MEDEFSRSYGLSMIGSIPNDENGDVLRQMLESGDDLSKPRDIDFTVVVPEEAAARALAAHFASAGYRTKIKKSGVVLERPWDVVIIKHMVPDHAEITKFEVVLEQAAAPLNGRNDGWGCFEQP